MYEVTISRQGSSKSPYRLLWRRSFEADSPETALFYSTFEEDVPEYFTTLYALAGYKTYTKGLNSLLLEYGSHKVEVRKVDDI